MHFNVSKLYVKWLLFVLPCVYQFIIYMTYKETNKEKYFYNTFLRISNININVSVIRSLSPSATGFLLLLGIIQEVIVTFFTLLT